MYCMCVCVCACVGMCVRQYSCLNDDVSVFCKKNANLNIRSISRLFPRSFLEEKTLNERRMHQMPISE